MGEPRRPRRFPPIPFNKPSTKPVSSNKERHTKRDSQAHPRQKPPPHSPTPLHSELRHPTSCQAHPQSSPNSSPPLKSSSNRVIIKTMYKMVNPKPCKEIPRRPHLFMFRILVGSVPCQPSLAWASCETNFYHKKQPQLLVFH